MAIAFEWDKDRHGRSVLLAKKARGKISIRELQEAMTGDYNYMGAWAIVLVAREDSGYAGWGDIDEPKGDVLELYQIGDGEECALCAVVYSGVDDYCPHCGERIKPEGSGGA